MKMDFRNEFQNEFNLQFFSSTENENDDYSKNDNHKAEDPSLLEKFRSRRKSLGMTNYSLDFDLKQILKRESHSNESLRNSYNRLEPVIEASGTEEFQKFQCSLSNQNTVIDSWLNNDLSPSGNSSYQPVLPEDTRYYDSNLQVSPNVPFTPIFNDIFNFDFSTKDDSNMNQDFNNTTTFYTATSSGNVYTPNTQQNFFSTYSYENKFPDITCNAESNFYPSHNPHLSQSENSANLLRKFENNYGAKPKRFRPIGAERSFRYERQKRQEAIVNARRTFNEQMEQYNQNHPQEPNNQ